MPIFAYQARDREGRRVAGTHEASDGRAALEALRAQGFAVTKLAPVGHAAAPVAAAPTAPPAPRLETPRVPAPTAREMPPPPPRREMPAVPPSVVPPAPDVLWRPEAAPEHVATQPLLRADAKQLSLYFRQMHAMIHAGSSVGQALSLMAKNAPNAALRHASAQMSERTTRGEEWNAAMRPYPGLFSELMIGMVSAGEHGGFLDRMCARLADYSERDYELQQTVKRETLYPKMVFVMSFLIPSVVPLVLHGFGAWWDSMKGVIFIAVIGFILWKAFNTAMPGALSSGPLRAAIDEAKLKTPVVSKCVRSSATAKFCRALGALQAAGMGLHKTVMLSADACGNEAIAQRTRRIIHRLDKGETLTEALTASGAFPPIALQMLHVGEMSGSIETQLDKVADFLEQDAETAIKAAVKIIGVAAFLLVAIKVGMQIVHFYSDYAAQIDAASGDGP